MGDDIKKNKTWQEMEKTKEEEFFDKQNKAALAKLHKNKPIAEQPTSQKSSSEADDPATPRQDAAVKAQK